MFLALQPKVCDKKELYQRKERHVKYRCRENSNWPWRILAANAANKIDTKSTDFKLLQVSFAHLLLLSAKLPFQWSAIFCGCRTLHQLFLSGQMLIIGRTAPKNWTRFERAAFVCNLFYPHYSVITISSRNVISYRRIIPSQRALKKESIISTHTGLRPD